MSALSFSARNKDALSELFGLMGPPFSEDSAINAQIAKELWLSEHRSLVAEYPDDLLIRVYEEFGPRLGLVGENLPEPGTAVRRMHNPGGTVRAMIKRFRLYERLETAGEQLGPFLCWAGQRLRDLRLGETVPELVEFVRRENLAILDELWFKAQLAKNDEHPNRYRRPFATETEIMILCAKVVFGDQLRHIHTEHIDKPSQIPGVPGRRVLYYQFSRPNRADIIVLNGAAIQRFDGAGNSMEPRPTLASTAREVAEIWGFEGTEGLMVSNPHSERLTLEANGIVRTLGFNPTFVVYSLAGPDVTETAAKVRQGKTILGEIARILYLEQK